MLFDAHPKEQSRSIPFITSTVVHVGLLVLWLFIIPAGSFHSESSAPHKYHVRFLDLSIEKGGGGARSGTNGGWGTPGFAGRSGLQIPERKPGVQRAATEGPKDGNSENAEARRRTREFQLAPAAQTGPIKETLIQPDVTGNVMIPENIPIPAAIMWTQAQPPPFATRKFVAPPLKELPKLAVSVPTPLALKPPNGAVRIADVRVAPMLTNEVAHLPTPPVMSSPVVMTGPQEAKQMPQTVLPKSKDNNVMDLISIPDTPSVARNIAVLPPANQIAPPEPEGIRDLGARNEDGGTAGHEGSGASTNPGGSGRGSQGKGTGAEGSGQGSGSANSGSGGSTGAGNGGTGESGTGAASGQANGRGQGIGSGSGAGNGGGLDLRGSNAVTKLDLPKEGKFNVVVLGSEAPTPDGAAENLSGRIVYTVYIDVGLRRKWILEYCLPKAAEQRIAVKGRATPLDPPWPFLLLRADRFNASDFDYVMLHGNITDEGHFDELGLVYPQDLPERKLLLQSLQQWAFRPASRDGEPVAVEVLLIIPAQPD